MNANDKDLEDQASANENLSKVCGWAVVAGLVIEVILAAVFRGHASWIENWAPVFADVLIALGIFGEIHFSGKVSKTEEELRRRSAEKVAEANARAEEAQLETEKLREQLAPRRLMPEKQKQVEEKLKAFAGRNVSVGARPALGESEVVVRLLYAALSEAGLNVSHDQNPMYLPAYPGGILVGSTSDPTSRGLASEIAEAFNEAGMFTTVMPFLAVESVDPSSVSIIVGEKPAAEDVALIKVRKAEAAAATNKQLGDNP